MPKSSEKTNPLRRLGIFTASTFLVGSVLIASVIGFRNHSFLVGISHPYVPIQLGIAALFFLSAFSEKLYFIQPVIYLIIAPINFLDSHDSFYGLGFFVMAVLLLFKIGFLNRFRILKSLGLLAYLYGWELFAALRSNRPSGLELTPVFYVTVFLLYLYILYKEQIIVYLKTPKPLLDLRAKGLSGTEIVYLQDLERGMSPKEIAAVHEVSDSTVRNTLARVYRKMGVKDKAELSSLLAEYTIKTD